MAESSAAVVETLAVAVISFGTGANGASTGEVGLGMGLLVLALEHQFRNRSWLC